MVGRRHRSTDLALCTALALVALGAAWWLPPHTVSRALLTTPVLLFVPGYLLLQALALRATSRWPLFVQVLLSVGITIPLVGMLALTTAVRDGAFGPFAIVGSITAACLVLAATAFVRRRAAEKETSASALDAREENAAG